jgi:hypothetical protein
MEVWLREPEVDAENLSSRRTWPNKVGIVSFEVRYSK